MDPCVIIGSSKVHIPGLEGILRKAAEEVTKERLERQLEIARWMSHERSMSVSNLAREDARECVTI